LLCCIVLVYELWFGRQFAVIGNWLFGGEDADVINW
jgi:hypothetical protein